MMDIFPLEVTAMGVTGILLLFNILTPEEAISGFSNKAVIIIGAIFIISRSLVKTGFLEVLADYMYQWGGKRKWPTIIIFLFTVSIISGFINNTAAVAIFIPLAINLCQRFHISPTKLLLPLSYAAIFGGTLTLIGTSEDHDALNDCVDCPVLQFSPYKGQSEDCYPCLTANVAGSSTCAGCNPGTYKNRSGVCLNCPIGFYTNQQSLSQCSECPKGFLAVTTLSLDGILRYDRCRSCPRGTFGIATKAKTLAEGCDNCTSGTYSDVEAVTRADGCKGCPKGT